MELLESDDRKSQLQKKTAIQRQALEDEAKLLSERTEKTITTALVIGGALFATYFLVRQFSSSEGKRKSKPKRIKLLSRADDPEDVSVLETQTPGIFSQVGAAIASQASIFLLTLAKEKLFEFLESQQKPKTDERS